MYNKKATTPSTLPRTEHWWNKLQLSEDLYARGVDPFKIRQIGFSLQQGSCKGLTDQPTTT